MENEIIYELTSPIDYANKGASETAQRINLIAPSSKNMAECAFLKQAFFRALPKEADEDAADKAEDDKVDGHAVMTIIAMSVEVDLAKVMIAAKKLLTSGVAMVDGEVKLTVPLADMLSNDDLEQMAGEYMANFILASALEKMKKK